MVGGNEESQRQATLGVRGKRAIPEGLLPVLLQNPLGRNLVPSDVNKAVAFLASDAAPPSWASALTSATGFIWRAFPASTTDFTR